MLRLYTVLLPVLLCGPAAGYSFSGSVTAVTGADRVEVLRRKKTEKVTLAGVTVPPEKEAAARKVLFERLLEKNVVVEVKNTGRDGYKVSDVALENGWNPALEFLKLGLAVTVPGPNCTREMRRLENSARLARRGVWAEGGPAPVADAAERVETAAPARGPDRGNSSVSRPGYAGRVKEWWRDSVNSMRRRWHEFKNEN
ncbi:MAG: thermonuclease family protein [Elusimicrobiaceae bacterium]|nr:thermonuclease family protein [Elusimicrobiaceae bacterium]